MTSYEKELICPVCEDYFISPLVLPCQHNLCHKCAIKMMGTTQSQTEDADRSNSPSVGSVSSSSPLPSPKVDENSNTKIIPPLFYMPRRSKANKANSCTQSPTNTTSPLGRHERTRLPSNGSRPTSPYISSPTPDLPISPTSDTPDCFEETMSRRSVDGHCGSGSNSPCCPKRRSYGGTRRTRSSSGSPVVSPSLLKKTNKFDFGSTSSIGSDKSNSSKNSKMVISITMQKGTGARKEATKPTEIYCPTCDRHVRLGESGINRLFRNFTLQSIVDKYKRTAKKNTVIHCQHCKGSTPSEATRRCYDCNECYCSECFKNAHPWGTPRANHSYCAADNTRPKTIMCTEHTEERVGWYCDACQRPTCRVCKVTNVHHGHRMYAIKVTYSALKDKLKKHVNALQSKRDEIEGAIGKFETAVVNIEANAEMTNNCIVNGMDELRKLLDEKQASLIERVEKAKVEKLQGPVKRLQSLNAMLANTVLIEYAQEVLNEEEQACFVQSALPLIGRLEKLLKSFKQEQETIETEVDSQTVIDLSREKELVINIDFLQVPGTPAINTNTSTTYDGAIIVHWDRPLGGSIIDNYTMEYIKASEMSIPTSQQSPMTEVLELVWEVVTEIKDCNYSVDILDADTEYCFRVKAMNKAGCGPYSDIAIIKSPP
ncbi:E3 ubiquitin-protein ligase TRIM36-like [Saccoglossus kowalevskii]|uniref:E3 ubiquitin-protein ligase TRIM36-like n=1 Tax=Saccoglossus kowalevskii TaxID=10224 RepID=A0ABM0GSM3_SACKO|nr:PREDICTED: E3 ubiquitin-protein ligase TRIM36-like [Saccoglossus kowalevskii]